MLKKSLLVTILALMFMSPALAANQTASTTEQSPSLAKNIKEWVEVFAPIVGVLGGLYTLLQGVNQYKAEQKWKRLEFTAEKYKEFELDSEINNILWMLDWEEKIMEFKDFPEPFLVNDLLIIESLKNPEEHRQKGSSEYSREQVVIRESFGEFLDKLEIFRAYIDSGLITQEDFKPYLDYWLKIIANHPEAANHKPDDFYKNLWNFIDRYQYKTRDLLNKYGYEVNLPKSNTNTKKDPE